MKEKKWQTIWNQYLREKKFYGYFELKATDTDNLPFSEIKEHQLEGLIAAENSGFVYKLSDADPREKPFDCLNAMPAPAFVVIKYPDGFYVIPAYIFKNELKNSDKKSLSIDRAKYLCCKIVRV